MSYSRYVAIKDFRQMVKTICNDNAFAERVTALLVVFYSTGMTLSEVSRLKVGDVVDAQGLLKASFELTPESSFNGNIRRIYWIAGWLDSVVSAYLTWRKETFPDHCLGDGTLPLEAPFFVDDIGEGYKEQKATEINQKIYKTSTALSLKIRQVHREGKIKDGNAESARRSFSVWLALGHLTGTPVHVDWLRILRGDQRLSTTMSAIHKDMPEGFDPLVAVFADANPLHLFR